MVGCKRQVPLPQVGKPFPASVYDGKFVVGRRLPPGASADTVRLLVKSLLGLGALLGRSVILPPELCDCSIPADGSPPSCTGDGPPPFDCPLAIPLDTAAWATTSSLPAKATEARDEREMSAR